MKKKIKEIFRSSNITSRTLNSEYSLGRYKIILPDDHALKIYQKKYPLYDRFLPILCANFEGLIIDIGANIGDTSIAIFSKNSESFVVGIEPDVFFYNECVNNVFLNGLTGRFLGVNKFVSTHKGYYSIEKSITLSTGSIVSNVNQSGENNSISFSELMNLIPSDKSVKFDILKIDTDGFDWDIINSFIQYYNDVKIKPRFLFFEMQTYLNNLGVKDKNRNQIIEDYKLSIQELQKIGYNNFCLFDNFGTHIKITQSIDEIFEINDYIARSQVCNSHSTIYYIDILVFFDEEFDCVKRAVSNLYQIAKEK